MIEQESEEESPDAQATEATEGNGGGRGMRSGTKYPYYDLEAAEKFAKAIQDSGGNEVLEEDLLKHLGVASSTKSWIYGLSTAKEFGLVERKGQKAEARIMLTDLAKRLLRPGDNDELMVSRAAAFLNPPVYKKVFDRYKGATVPQIEFLANLLVRDHKLLDSVATPAAQAFIASAKLAGLATNNVLGDSKKPEKKAEDKPPVGDVPSQDPPPGQRTLNVPSDFNLYTYPLRRDLTVSIPLPSALTKKDVERLHKWLDTLIFEDEATPT